MRSAAFSPDGTRVVTASKDHTARVWDVQPDMGTLPESERPAAGAVKLEAAGDPLIVLLPAGWVLERLWATGHDLVNPESGGCLDANGPSSANGTRLQISGGTCGSNQKWIVPGT